jgi:hypothetical protein
MLKHRDSAERGRKTFNGDLTLLADAPLHWPLDCPRSIRQRPDENIPVMHRTLGVMAL